MHFRPRAAAINTKEQSWKRQKRIAGRPISRCRTELTARASLEGRKKFHNKRPLFVAFDASGGGRCLSPLTPRAATAAAAAATGYLSFSEDRDSCSRSSQSVNAEGEAMSWVSEGCLDYTNCHQYVASDWTQTLVTKASTRSC